MTDMTGKMSEIEVLETSGVDHPAHLHEGFLVMKAATPERARAALAVLGKDKDMTTPAKPAAPAGPTLTPEALSAAVEKAVDAKLQPVLDAIAGAWKDLRDYAEQSDEEIPSTEGDPAAPAADPVLQAVSAEALKALPVEVAKAINAQRDEVTKAREELQKERDARLDSEAITKAATDFPNLGLSDDIVKSIRRISEKDAALGTALSTLLTSTNAMLDGAPLLKELGAAGEGSDKKASEQVEEKAKALVAEGKYDTIQKARVAIYESEPALAAAVQEEVR